MTCNQRRERFGFAARAGVFGATLIAAGALSAGAALAKADLVIVKEDSVVNFGTCERDDPLATGQIAIRNAGSSRAVLRLGVVSRFTRSMLSVYEPEHPDMVDNAKERSLMDPRDQESVKFSLGARVVKKGRFPGTVSESGSSVGAPILDVEVMTSDEKKDLQRALNDLGYYRGAIDGLFGTRHRNAVSAYQRALGDQATGDLTVSQTIELSRKSGRSLSLGTSETSASGAISSTRIPVVIYAVVDPFNLVEESDETNNIAKFRGEITCN